MTSPLPAIDPAMISAAVAPALPPDHRQSLAAVFRALAHALEGVAPHPGS